MKCPSCPTPQEGGTDTLRQEQEAEDVEVQPEAVGTHPVAQDCRTSYFFSSS